MNPSVKRVRKGMKSYDIPVDEQGNVPLWAIVERYHAVGSKKDHNSTAEKVLPAVIKPEDIVDWWADTESCDVEGVDTKDAPIYYVPLSIRGEKRRLLSQIAVISPTKKEVGRIKKILADHFTIPELQLMAKDESLIIRTVPYMESCTGYYLRKQDGVEVPQIVLEEGTTTDGIVHESIHDLRAKDGRTPFPMKGSKLDSKKYQKMSKSKRDSIVTEEETKTTAETVVRTCVDDVQSGYYDLIPNKKSRSAYLEDQKILSNNKSIIGTQAIKRTEESYSKANISRAVISSSRKTSAKKTVAKGKSAPKKKNVQRNKK